MSATPPRPLPPITNFLLPSTPTHTLPVLSSSRSFSLQSLAFGSQTPFPPPLQPPRTGSVFVKPEPFGELPHPVTVNLPNRTVVLRCVCGESDTDCLLVPCSRCGFFVHGRCVCVPRVTLKMKYVCPFCSQRQIRCTCENPRKFDEPLIQCTRCKYWVHKACAGFLFGRIPDGFLCWKCGTARYRLPKSRFLEGSLCRDSRNSLNLDRAMLLAKLPEGEFRDKVEEDLGKSEFDFRETMCAYVDEFVPCLFDFTKEFWKVFVASLTEMLGCERSDVMAAIDELVTNMFYAEPNRKHKTPIPGLVVSDSIAPDIANEKLPKLDLLPESIPIALTNDMRVIAEKEVDNGSFICEIPGLLCHEDEVDANDGIPRSIIGIPDTRIVVDVSRSSTPILQHIRRSFNFNCDVRLLRVNGEVKVGLYGTRLRGLLCDDKSVRGSSIAENGELFLPIDVALPYPVDKPFWKIKKAKPQIKPKKMKPKTEKKAGEQKQPKKKRTALPPTTETRAMKTRSRTEFPFVLTLLSSFCEDACPPMPIIIKDKREIEEENPDPDSIRGRIRQRHNKHVIEEMSE